jgi:hypothetical protein
MRRQHEMAKKRSRSTLITLAPRLWSYPPSLRGNQQFKGVRLLYEHHVAALRAKLDEAAFSQEWALGRCLLLDAVIALALGSDGFRSNRESRLSRRRSCPLAYACRSPRLLTCLWV